MTTPLRPEIRLTDRRGLVICNCCGVEDGTVRMLEFRWNDDTHPRKPLGGGTAVALCLKCRRCTVELLAREPRGVETPRKPSAERHCVPIALCSDKACLASCDLAIIEGTAWLHVESGWLCPEHRPF